MVAEEVVSQVNFQSGDISGNATGSKSMGLYWIGISCGEKPSIDQILFLESKQASEAHHEEDHHSAEEEVVDVAVEAIERHFLLDTTFIQHTPPKFGYAVGTISVCLPFAFYFLLFQNLYHTYFSCLFDSFLL